MKRGREEESSPVNSGDKETAEKNAKKNGSCDIEAANDKTSSKTTTNVHTSTGRCVAHSLLIYWCSQHGRVQTVAQTVHDLRGKLQDVPAGTLVPCLEARSADSMVSHSTLE